MNVGDKVKLKACPAVDDVIGLVDNAVGTIRDIDVGPWGTAFLISFPGLALYSSAVREEDLEVVEIDPKVSIEEIDR